MDSRVELALLMDCYGPLLTEHKRRALTMHVDEDMSYQEIADALGITRQGVHAAVEGGRRQLARYEKALGLAARYAGVRRAMAECREALGRVRAAEGAQADLDAAARALDQIEWMER